jgi:hypothetical protein
MIGQSSQEGPQEEGHSLIYELMARKEQESGREGGVAGTRQREWEGGEVGQEAEEYGELLQVEELTLGHNPALRDFINTHEHIEEDTKIKIFIDPNPAKPPPKHTPPPHPAPVLNFQDYDTHKPTLSPKRKPTDPSQQEFSSEPRQKSRKEVLRIR